MFDYNRRFGGISRLYGDTALRTLQASHVCIVGLGGVGSWVAEALARTGVGTLTLIDLDNVAESNINRQLQALTNTLGQAKISALADRIVQINPTCQVHLIEDFITPDNCADYLQPHFDCVVDAIDQVRTKATMIAYCVAHQRPIICTGGAGGKTNPLQIQVADLSQTIQDPLASKVRARLRKDYGFRPAAPKDASKKTIKSSLFGVECVFSTEPLRYPNSQCDTQAGLNCAGFGSSVMVTASFGFAVAARVVEQLLAASKQAHEGAA